MVEDSKVWKQGIRSSMNPSYAHQYSYRRVRDPTALEVAMSPGPACRHTHTHISYFPFLFIRIAVGRGPLFESPWLGCHNRRAWWPAAAACRPARSLVIILHLRMQPGASCSFSLSLSFSLTRACNIVVNVFQRYNNVCHIFF